MIITVFIAAFVFALLILCPCKRRLNSEVPRIRNLEAWKLNVSTNWRD